MSAALGEELSHRLSRELAALLRRCGKALAGSTSFQGSLLQPLTRLSSHLPSSYKDAFEDFKEKGKKQGHYRPILIANINNCGNFR